MRKIYEIVIDPEAKARIERGECPSCALPKSQWKRRTDWRCCSSECTTKFENEKIIRSWPELRMKALERDNYRCKQCSHQPIQEIHIRDEWDEIHFQTSYGWRFIGFDRKEGSKIMKLIDDSKLIGDHIKPIALGGEEFDINNVQTLCVACNKVKTANDLRDIALSKKSKGNQKL